MRRFKRFNTKANRIVLNYLIFGVLTTIVNILSFALLTEVFNVSYKISTTAAWIMSVLFAYLTNKFFVFQSREVGFFNLLKESFLFVGFRFLSYLADIFLMILLVETFKANTLFSKIISNVIVILLNYLISKFMIFNRMPESDQQASNQNAST